MLPPAVGKDNTSCGRQGIVASPVSPRTQSRRTPARLPAAGGGAIKESDERARLVRDLTGSGGHVTLELTGDPAAIPEGLAMTRAEGRYVVIGNIAGDATLPFNLAWLVHLNRRMIGVGGYQAWALRRGLELLERTHDRYPFRKILSHDYPLERINDAFANADRGGTIRTALVCAPDLVVR